jgi:hypothetical protein
VGIVAGIGLIVIKLVGQVQRIELDRDVVGRTLALASKQ